MKKIIILVLATLVLSSCSNNSNNDENMPPANLKLHYPRVQILTKNNIHYGNIVADVDTGSKIEIYEIHGSKENKLDEFISKDGKLDYSLSPEDLTDLTYGLIVSKKGKTETRNTVLTDIKETPVDSPEISQLVDSFNKLIDHQSLQPLQYYPTHINLKNGFYNVNLMHDGITDSSISSTFDKNMKLHSLNYSGGSEPMYMFYLISALGIEKEVPYQKDYLNEYGNNNTKFSKKYSTSKFDVLAFNHANLKTLEIIIK
ncbi:hypothetical protein HCA00_04845 [Listeria booriae]|uniref:hypothetical protein n=1 Tax=Listeria booriae TaxID=1552123 RepID=UPI00164D788F|nr:hypothetical protein [Listeria booriae]MBC6128111.1 hypothetical protein [Listeria booriae]